MGAVTLTAHTPWGYVRRVQSLTSSTPIYLDSAASTPVRPEVLEAMLPYFTEVYANPSGHHAGGYDAAAAIDDARGAMASVLGSIPEELVFTSGGTESINAALKGVALAQRDAGIGAHIVTTAIEHHAVLHSVQYLERFGFEVDYVAVDEFGRVDPDEVAAAVRPDTVLVSVMYANNEVGTVQPIEEVAGRLRDIEARLGRRVPFHTDAVQAANSKPLNVDRLGVDLLSLSGHKFGGPKGTGLLYIRRDIPFLEQMSGGGQERQRRSGTENTPGIVGLSTALVLAQGEREAYVSDTSALRDRLREGVTRTLPDVRFNGHPTERLPNNLHFCIPGVEGEAVVEALDQVGVACSAGAACTSSTWEPSHVLLAMDVPLELAIGSVRMSLSPSLTAADIDFVIEQLPPIVERLRLEAPVVL